MIEILILLAKSLPVIAVLWLVIQYLISEKKSYVKKIDELQTELRATEKSTLILLNQLTNTLGKIFENSEEDKKEILSEITKLHKDLSKKLSELKK